MKKILKLSCFALFAVLASCSSDDDSTDTTTTSVNYWPLSENNYWTYSSASDATNTATDTIKIGSHQTINGNVYHNITGQLIDRSVGLDVNPAFSISKQGSVYKMKQGDVTTELQGVSLSISGGEYTYLKEPETGLASWTDTQSLGITFNGIPFSTYNTDIVGEIVERDLAMTINGRNFTEVIKSKVILNLRVDMAGINQENVMEIWYANGVGPIKIKTTADGTVMEYNIKSFQVN
ncbi:MAG: hypothetical protein KBS98_09260 [Flavobacterium sp.]|nr:hypothetical protein [Candidatus Neoflavobacterium equi]